jgi:glycosyltransferase involved in cell wall biosynthesis
MNSESFVTVITPAYNAELTIAAALDSVLQQTVKPAEVIVVDDGSTDGTAQIVQRYRDWVYYFRQENCGPAAARNVGIALAKGEILAFLDADDVWPSNALQLLLTAVSRDPAVEVVQGHLQDLWPAVLEGKFMLGHPRLAFNLGSAIYRRMVFSKAGDFNPVLRSGEDFDFWVRVKERGIRREIIPAVTLYYRRKKLNRAEDTRNYYSNLIHTLKRSLDRRRGR